MHLRQRRPASSWRRFTGVAAALPLLVAGLLTSPAQAAPASESVIASGIYCLASDRVAGTASFYDSPTGNGTRKLSESDLRYFAHLYYGIYGDSAGQVDAITCTPEHLSITYKIDDLVRSEGSYLDLSFGTTTVTPGSGEHTYSFSPTVTTSADNTPQKITATVQKPAENAAPR